MKTSNVYWGQLRCSGIILVLTYLTLAKTLQGKYRYRAHFTDENTKHRELKELPYNWHPKDRI